MRPDPAVGASGIPGGADCVDPVWVQPAGHEATNETREAEVLVAEHVGDDVADPPAVAQRR
jgi:hypothetical protein